MSNNQANVRTHSTTSTFAQILGRLVTAAIVLAITAFFTPGFTINNIWTLAIAAIVLTIIDYLIVKFTGLEACFSCCYFICNSILCCRLLYLLDCLNNWRLNLWCY